MRYTFVLVLFILSFSLHAQKVRDFSAVTTENETVSFYDLKGSEATVIDFWASWCKPCLKAMPHVEYLHQSFADKGVSVIGVNTDGPRSQAKVKPIINSLHISYPILMDMNNQIMNDLNITVLPTIIIFDKEGVVVYRHEGYVKGDEKEWQVALEKIL